MQGKYVQSPSLDSSSRFSAAPFSDVEHSRVTKSPELLTTFNAGDIVPIYCREVLPGESVRMRVDSVIRQTTLLTPTMGSMFVDICAYFVPNRIVNESWNNVMGENTSSFWTSPEVELAPLYHYNGNSASVQIPVGSVADYYGLPTQQAIPGNVLAAMHDLEFRGYLAIYNEWFRDQNYQPIIPFSKLNVYEGFLLNKGTQLDNISAGRFVESDGSCPDGAVVKAVFGEGSTSGGDGFVAIPRPTTSWSALDKPLKANKIHDYFTSVLPSPQKGDQVSFKLTGSAPVSGSSSVAFSTLDRITPFSGVQPLRISFPDGTPGLAQLGIDSTGAIKHGVEGMGTLVGDGVNGWNVQGTASADGFEVDLSSVSSITLSDLRTGAAIQRAYETLARSGSRYREFIAGFFNVEVPDYYLDIPKRLGHIRRSLDIYQTAQTSASAESSTPQGNLAAFGYTATGGDLFHETFVEHGYIHVFAIVRHKNIYPSYIDRSKFRRSFLDFYNPQLSNLSEQPVYTREINPFIEEQSSMGAYVPKVFGYQEAWAEYRHDPSRVTGYQRSGVSESLSVWNYADNFDNTLVIAEDDWLRSNSEEVLNRSLAVTSEVAPQFKAQFRFMIEDDLPMPVYDVPGLDIL